MTIAPEWPGAVSFIVAGGPSFASQDHELLRWRRVIAINSSWKSVPFADFLFFGDDRWWRQYSAEVLAGFRGRIATCAAAVHHPRLMKLRRIKPAVRLSNDRGEVMMRRTSLTGAINLAVHLGSRAIVLLGVDGKAAEDGRTHHHEPYPPALTNGRANQWAEQREDIECAAASLKAIGIPVFNASPGSALADLWPVMSLPQAIEQSGA